MEMAISAKPGRPPQFSEDQRRQLVIDAAEDVFIKKGYHAATMDDIAKRAGMSKKTLYQLFAAKAALFEALLADRLSIFSEPLKDDDGDLEQALTDFLTRSAEFLLSPKQIALTRLMITEVQISPEIGEALEKRRLCLENDALKIWMEKQVETGRLKIGNPHDATEMLMSFIVGKTHFELLFNLIPQPTLTEIERKVRHAVRIFLAGIHAMA